MNIGDCYAGKFIPCKMIIINLNYQLEKFPILVKEIGGGNNLYCFTQLLIAKHYQFDQKLTDEQIIKDIIE